MRISSFFYTIGQGFKNLGRNKWYTLASIATISACLFLFGLFYSIITNFQNVVKTAEEGVSVTVFFNEGVGEEQILVVKSDLEKRPEVREIVYVSADEAWEGFKEEYLGEYADGFTENPLADSANLQIYLNDVSMQGALVTYIESIDVVREVNRSEVTATTLSGLNKLIAYISAGIIIILLLVSIFLISNTVTMGIAVRKDEINIMKYIGATDFFVRAPFVVEGIIIGIIGSLIPLVIIYFVYTNAISYIVSKFTMLSSILNFLPVEIVFNKLFPISLAIGIGIGFFGSFTTVRKHLHV
ncbi:cell division transport system permease protein [Butyrivibrio hungatei DSM 14810]|uniref:Cell division protein FtsX n=2 Tax=Butyrivibrio hungatei TaxID=185008 RepID=A0A1D9P4I3_9FIRM|nr:permease-like cell division protein FtsX [Butyrivibrio hungatei]AOZ97498.1 cell division protein FtsX [Butyrivibrio hungatei]SHN62704.1 cell division transport system permease protein [Butyrivibrio hungatei DSM 14810]